MMTIHDKLRHAAFVLALSITALPTLVNAQNQKDPKDGVTKLIEVILRNGTDSDISSTLAPIIGLQKAMPMKKLEVVTKQRGTDIEMRACFIAYENAESSSTNMTAPHMTYIYIVKMKRAGLDKEMRYFRIDLNGRLEKVVLSQSKYDATGKIVRGSGVKFDQDIDSPEVKKTFETEMKFWLKDWLPKQLKTAAKNSPAPTPR